MGQSPGRQSACRVLQVPGLPWSLWVLFNAHKDLHEPSHQRRVLQQAGPQRSYSGVPCQYARSGQSYEHAAAQRPCA